MRLGNHLVGKWSKLIRQHRRKVIVALLASALVLLLALSAIVIFLRRPHAATNTTNNRVPQTGISIIFRSPITAPSHVEIDSSLGKKVAVYTLVKANNTALRNTIADPKGIKFNIPLHEGVYLLKISSSNTAIVPMEETVTVPEHTLTTINVSFM